MGDVMLTVRNLVAGVGRKPIARLPKLDVAAGQSALLAGSSGSGKTTLLLAIAGLAETIDGQIRIGDIETGTLSSRARDRHRGRHIGVVFQDLHLVPGLSALDNMLLAPFATGVARDRARALAMLDRLGVGDRAIARAQLLSRGEAQRVAIARAMLLGPQLILADEPTASLDDEACHTVLDLLLDATRESGAALVIATHDNRVRARIGQVATAEAV